MPMKVHLDFVNGPAGGEVDFESIRRFVGPDVRANEIAINF